MNQFNHSGNVGTSLVCTSSKCSKFCFSFLAVLNLYSNLMSYINFN
jgi:hypothetical protein